MIAGILVAAGGAWLGVAPFARWYSAGPGGVVPLAGIDGAAMLYALPALGAVLVICGLLMVGAGAGATAAAVGLGAASVATALSLWACLIRPGTLVARTAGSGEIRLPSATAPIDLEPVGLWTLAAGALAGLVCAVALARSAS